MPNLTHKQAQFVVHAALREAEARNVSMNVAVVDSWAHLIYFSRQDGAWLGSIDIAITKARTARYFDMPTGQLGELSLPGQPLYNIEHTNGALVTFPGGIPLKLDGQIIGAIGVSGSTVDNDHAVAAAGTAALDSSPLQLA